MTAPTKPSLKIRAFEAEPGTAEKLFRIQEVASELGLTTRSIRYYEEIGLLQPAARSEGAYRLYDASDVERLRFIKALRDDAGFSLADIGLMLEDEAARERTREAFRRSEDRLERRDILTQSLARTNRQLALLGSKIERLQLMVVEAEARRARITARLADIEAGGLGDLAPLAGASAEAPAPLLRASHLAPRPATEKREKRGGA